MPTGYTAQIMEKDFDLKKWLVEELPRNFGLLISLRDSGKLDEKQILKELEDDNVVEYHLKKMKKTKKDLASIKIKSDTLLKKEMDKINKSEVNRVKNYVKKNEKGKKKFNEIKEKLIKLKYGANEFVNKVLDFGISQIDQTADYDFKYVPELVQFIDVNKYREFLIKKATQDVIYHQEEYVKALDNRNERVEIYKQYIKFIKENLKEMK